MTKVLDLAKVVGNDLVGKRVLILFPHMVAAGGALSYSLHLAEQLLVRGARVGMLVLRADPDAFDLPAGLEVITLDGPLTSSLGYWLRFFAWQKRLNRAMADWRPDVLVPQVFPANWWGWLAKRRNPQVPLVWVCHEPSAFIHSRAWIQALRPWWKSQLARLLNPVLRRIDLALVRGSDRIIANSRHTAAALAQVYGRAADAIACPGIDFAALAGGTGPKQPALVTVGRLTRFKRVDFLLEVFREVLKGHPDLTYHIVGTGEEEPALRELAGRLGLGTRVVFHGAVTDRALRELVQGARVFLHGSIDEPFGMAPLESLACGTPVVAHRSGGPTEFVTAECGRLVGSLAVADWSAAISACLAEFDGDPACSARVKECARRFDWSLSLQPGVEVIAGLCRDTGTAG